MILGMVKVYKASEEDESSAVIFLFTFTQLPPKSSTIFNMMKYVILAALVAVAVARPQKETEIVASNNENQGDGKYQWDFKTSDGAAQAAQGSLTKNPAPSNEAERGYDEVQSVQGSYGYTAEGGKNVQVTYESGPNGYRPKVVIS